MYSESIKNLVKAFSKLPTIGSRGAERFVFHLLKSGKKEVGELTLSLKNLIENIKSCETCWRFSDQNPCEICSSSKRNHKIICIVEEQQDVEVFEKMGNYDGVYHVLRGNIKLENEYNNKKLKTKELFYRLRKAQVEETIFALNPNIEGETTMMFLEKKIKEISPETKVTRLARGLPMGSDLQYADEITLASALKNRN